MLTRSVYTLILVFLSFLGIAQLPVELAIQKGHSAGIISAQYSDDGKYMVSLDANDVVKIWSMASGSELKQFNNELLSDYGFQFSRYMHFAFSKGQDYSFEVNGTAFQVTYTDSRVNILNVASGKKTAFNSEYVDEEFTSLAFSENHPYVFAGNTDGKIYWADLTTGKVGKALSEHLGPVTYVGFNPVENQFYSTSLDRSILIWDLNTLKPIKKLAPRSFGINAVALGNKTQFLAFGDELGNVKIVNLADYKFPILTKTFDYGKVMDLEFINDDKELLVGFEDNRICLLDVNSMKLLENSTYKFKLARDVRSFFFGVREQGIDKRQSYVYQIDQDPTGNYIILNGKIQTTSKQNNSNRWREDVNILNTSKLRDLTTFKASKLTNQPLFHNYMEVLTSSRRQTSIVGEFLNMDVKGERTSADNFKFTSNDILYLTDKGDLKALNGELDVRVGKIEEFEKKVAAKNDSLVAVAIGKTINIYEVGDSLTTYHLNNHSDDITALDISINGLLFSASMDGTIKIWDLKSKTLLLTMVPIDFDKLIMLTKENFYYSPTRTLNGLGFRSGKKFIPVSQFDLVYNRPDLVLSKLNHPEDIINLYQNAHQKRLKKMNRIDEDSLGVTEFHLPYMVVNSNIPNVVAKNRLNIQLEASDSIYMLSHVHIKLNGVPMFGSAGLKTGNTHQFELDTQVHLNAATNYLEISCFNRRGSESLKETYKIDYTGAVPKGDLHLLTLCVSDYKNGDKEVDLEFARTDGENLVSLFQGKKDQYDKIVPNTLFDESVTKENFEKLREKLYQTNVEDQVILFVSGHGVLDDNFDFYYATYDMDFKEPSKRGISYDDIENLLDSIPARKKLLLIDACHSGEIDKESIEKTEDVVEDASKLTFKGFETYRNRRTVPGLPNAFELMRELFNDYSNGAGVTVISAASGVEFAYESRDWKNGVFTYSIREALNKAKADVDKDKNITLRELQEYVSRRVNELTEGLQNPTTRKENLTSDFVIWTY